MGRFAFLSGVLAVFVSLSGCGTEKNSPGEPQEENSASTNVRTGEEAVVFNDEGVSLTIFDGTVPTDLSGNPGELVFSIEPMTSAASPPAGYMSAGSVWQMGPEGLTFGERCRLTMEVPDVTRSYALGRFDPSTGQWRVVPAILSPEGDYISADVKHLSLWTLFSPTMATLNPRAYGAINVRNIDGTRSVSLCIKSYTLAYPDTDASFDASSAGCLVAEAGHNGGAFGLVNNVNFVLPQGTYVFEATRSSPLPDINGAPWSDGWVEMEPITIGAPWAFGTDAPELIVNPSAWQNVTVSPASAPCEGQTDHSFGTGDIQVTLSWDHHADLDLHVIEPSGEEIFYGHPLSDSGGRLDRDRTCSTSGANSENVFWGSSTAPRGSYSVVVHLYSLCETGPSIPFRVRTIVGGVARTYSGSVVASERRTVTTFSR